MAEFDTNSRSSSDGEASFHGSTNLSSSRPPLVDSSNVGNGPISSASDEPSNQAFNDVLQSEIGITTLLGRLKQSIASARDFASFLKKRSALEEEHAQGLKKLCRSSHDTARRPESRQGSYAQNFDEVTQIHDRMADNGVQFAFSLHQMHEDLSELAIEKERGRKQWKQSGFSAEKKAQDAEAAMEKAKSKYESLAEDYERARTGDKQNSRVFGLKGPKSAAQVEEDLLRKVQTADSEYQSRVQIAQSLRQELVTSLRPQAVKALQDQIVECDSGLTLQLQKFASFNEKLLLGNGLCVSPLQDSSGGGAAPRRSLRDVIHRIDNERDLKTYVLGFTSRIGPKHPEIRYERHPTLQSSQPPQPIQTVLQMPKVPTQPYHSQQQQLQTSSALPMPPAPSDAPPAASDTRAATFGPDGQGFDHGFGHLTSHTTPPAHNSFAQSASKPNHSSSQADTSSQPIAIINKSGGLPALKPVFGISLDELFSRDHSAVPMIIHQCLQAVDLYGLDVEGIYRASGTSSHINTLRNIFDHDSMLVDFRNPETFFHDVNSVAGLLKQFLRELPDPLLTAEHYHNFIEAAHIDEDITRRDSLHAIINSLPDPNYATLRALTLHLNRVQEHSSANKMNAGNLAICFGPTLMDTSGAHMPDSGWQVRVVDTILQNTYQIFDED
ncbi:hypothetical protein MMC25_006059 [Agyrium rufum]|nr:hypothetical protein [Agyrium rufum]